jgi:S-adenosyl-L-methionine hydrolase (adenosine-forming)
MSRPLVALLTDFGSQDHYVGALKGAILTVCPEATLVDIHHEVPAHDVAEGAFSLAAAYGSFPPGTVFVAVVDPGVGSGRRALAIEAGRHRFVGPDNGIFSLVLEDAPLARVHQVTNASLFAPQVSPTFHARDLFGPVAARLASGLALEEVGPPLSDPVRLRAAGVRALGPGEWEGRVLHVDRFGNLITSFSRRDLEGILATVDGDPTELLTVVEGLVLPLARTYADVAEGEACALVGSGGRLEVAVHAGSAARILGASRDAPIRLRHARVGGR